jgi:hypothetical protein
MVKQDYISCPMASLYCRYQAFLSRSPASCPELALNFYSMSSYGWVSIAGGCRTQLFVNGKLVRLFTVFVSTIETRQPRAAVDGCCSSDTRPSQLKEHSTLKSLRRGTKNRSDLARHAPSSRAATWYQLCEIKQPTLPRAPAARNRYPAYRSCRYIIFPVSQIHSSKPVATHKHAG